MANYNSSHTGAEIDSAIGRVKDTAVTAGTVAASLGVVVDANKDISGFRNVTLTGQLQAATINLTGDTTIGDGDSDNITINADVNSNIIPNTDNTFDLGSASKQWKDLYVNGIGYIDQLGTDADPIAIYASSGEIDGTAIGSESASTGAFTTISASGNVDFNGDLDVDGTANLDVVDIDGAVDMASTLAVGGTLTVSSSTVNDDFAIFKNTDTTGGASVPIFLSSMSGGSQTNVSMENAGAGSFVVRTGNTAVSGFGTEALTIDSSQDATFTGTITVGASNGSEEVKANRTRVRHIDGLADASDYSHGDLFINHISSGNIICSSNVGIGTTSPTNAILEVKTDNENIARFDGLQGNIDFRYGSDIEFDRAGQVYITANNGSGELNFRTGGQNIAMHIDSSQRVGIGTTSPAYTLDLASSDAIVSQFTGSSGETILSLDNTSTNGDKWYLISGGSGGSFSGGKFGIYNADTTTAVATFTNSGNVGIGTTSPDNLLHIKTTGSTPSIELEQDAGTSYKALFKLAGNDLEIRGSSGTIEFFTGNNDGDSSTEKMRITSDGKVGIGETSPDSLLHISGVGDNNHCITMDQNGRQNAIGNFYSSDSTNSRMDFYISDGNTNGGSNVRMSITSAGNVLFHSNNGITAPTGTDAGSGILAGGASFQPNSVGRSILYLGTYNYTSAASVARFTNQNGVVGSIDVSGSGTAFSTSSDYRLKENEVTISDGLTRLNKLKPYRFNFKTDTDTTVDGFFAHEVSEVVPEAITGEKDAVDDDGNIVSQGIDQSKLVPLLVKAVQELTAKVEALENA